MAKQYIDTYVGAKDGTKAPPDRLDGRKVGAKRSSIWGAKPAGAAWSIGDTVFIADLAPGESIRDILVNADAALAGVVLSVGTLTDPSKYANAVAAPPINIPTSIGPKAQTAMLPPVTAAEDIYVLIGGAGVGAGVNVVFETIITSIK